MIIMSTLHTRAADMLERYGRVDGVMHCEVSMLIADLRAAAALDELVRENERLGLYDDQRPVVWRCRDYVTGCWFISVKPDPAGSIAGESVPLYAAPASTQPRQPLSEWIACSERLPEHDALRVIVYCTADRPENRMWCAIWNAGDQSFEADGGWFERDEITHWQPAPKRPIERAITGEKP